MSKYIEDLEKLDYLKANSHVGTLLAKHRLEKTMDMFAARMKPYRAMVQTLVETFIDDPFAELETNSDDQIHCANFLGLDVRKETSDDGTTTAIISVRVLSSYAYRPSPTE